MLPRHWEFSFQLAIIAYRRTSYTTILSQRKDKIFHSFWENLNGEYWFWLWVLIILSLWKEESIEKERRARGRSMMNNKLTEVSWQRSRLEVDQFFISCDEKLIMRGLKTDIWNWSGEGFIAVDDIVRSDNSEKEME